MSSPQETNIHDLQRRYWHGNGQVLEAAHFLNENATDEGLLRRVLRDYRLEPIRDQTEIRIRDAIDELLDFYSLQELACVSGFIEQQLPTETVELGRKYLGLSTLRRYYEEYYPLPLVVQHRERLEEIGYVADGMPDGAVSFIRFLQLTDSLNRDTDAQIFFRLLDDYVIDGTSWRHLRSILEEPAAQMNVLAIVPEEQTHLHRAVHGFGRFIEFCFRFNAYLDGLDRQPHLTYGAWQHQRYWFERFRERIEPVLTKALAALRGSADDEEERSDLDHAQIELNSVIQNLLDGPPAP